MNIHEAALQPIGAFVYCNRQAAAGCRPQAVAHRQKMEISTRQQAPVQMNPAVGRSLAKLFYDGITREIK